jgi:hypothetical protein
VVQPPHHEPDHAANCPFAAGARRRRARRPPLRAPVPDAGQRLSRREQLRDRADLRVESDRVKNVLAAEGCDLLTRGAPTQADGADDRPRREPAAGSAAGSAGPAAPERGGSSFASSRQACLSVSSGPDLGERAVRAVHRVGVRQRHRLDVREHLDAIYVALDLRPFCVLAGRLLLSVSPRGANGLNSSRVDAIGQVFERFEPARARAACGACAGAVSNPATEYADLQVFRDRSAPGTRTRDLRRVRPAPLLDVTRRRQTAAVTRPQSTGLTAIGGPLAPRSHRCCRGWKPSRGKSCKWDFSEMERAGFEPAPSGLQSSTRPSGLSRRRRGLPPRAGVSSVGLRESPGAVGAFRRRRAGCARDGTVVSLRNEPPTESYFLNVEDVLSEE